MSELLPALRPRTDREGVALALAAVLMLTLLALMSLGVDLGMAYTARVEAQRAADAAALAGAAAFLEHVDPFDAVTDAETWAREYAGLNQVHKRPIDPDADVQVQVIVAEEKVRVWVERTGLPTQFAKLLGVDEMKVSAVAAAQAINAGSSKCVKPLAIPDRWEELSGDDLEPDGDMDYDNLQPCNGQHCSSNEVWTFEPGVDSYRPSNQMSGETAWPTDQATSWGSEWQDPTNADAGAQILLTPQSAQGTGTPGWYQYWKMPGSSGASDLTEAIQGCVDLASLGVGSSVEADPQTGNIGNPVYNAFEHLWDPALGGDGDIQWDATNNVPYYPNDPGRSFWDSPRVFDVLLVHPADVQSGASHTMRIADIATVFLEVPTELYGEQGNTSFKLPITGRLIKFGRGTTGPNAGQLQKVIRLVQ